MMLICPEEASDALSAFLQKRAGAIARLLFEVINLLYNLIKYNMYLTLQSIQNNIIKTRLFVMIFQEVSIIHIVL